MRNLVPTQVKAITSAIAMLMGSSVIAISPTIQENSVSVSQPSSGGRVTISYRLVGAPAIVTIDIQTNTLADASGQWVSVGGEHLRHMVGAVNRVNKTLDGISEVYWNPHKEWTDDEPRFVQQVKAIVTAWPTNNPPPYMAIDLQNPSNVFFYASREAIPGGDTNDQYKTSWMLMRKIPAANVIWWMGTESGHRAQVALTEDYYCGIYELTQAQYRKFMSSASYSPVVTGDKLPVCGTRYDAVRGNLSPIGGHRWPDDGHAVGNALEKLRKATGVEFDFPTEAQWEFACKAGTTLDYGGAAIGDVAWYAGNWTEDTTISANEVHEVGLKNPNAYGLYDMHGNVWEVCLEGLVDYRTSWLAAWVPGSAPLIDPTNATNVPDKATWTDSFVGRYFVHKGGGYTSNAEDCRAGIWRAAADWNDVRTYDHLRGFRFVAPAIMPY